MTCQPTYRIAITGPESTGKSELAQQLATHFRTVWVPEYSREYLSGLNRKYNYEDILAIANGQFRMEEELFPKAGKLLFCDTDFLVSKIWCEEKYGECHPWILEKLEVHRYDLYLLCNTDLPWQVDTLRENPDDRDRLFNLYMKELKQRQYPFSVISGTGQERVNMAIRVIDSYRF